MKCITLSIVWRRCSIAWIIHFAAFMRVEMNSLFSPVELPLVARDVLVGAAQACRRGTLSSFTKT